MNTRHHTILLSFLGSAIVALTACNTEVVGGGGTGTGGHGAASTTATTGNGGAGNQGGGGDGGGVAGGNPGSNAIAMLYSELPVPGTDPDPTGTSATGVSATGTGGGPSGDTLYIAISDYGQQCEDPDGNYPCGNHWKVMFGIPVELQKVGVIQLNDSSIIAHALMTGPGTDQDCSAGQGTFWEGTLEITEIDDTHVAGVLSNTTKFDFDADGPFDALRCVF